MTEFTDEDRMMLREVHSAIIEIRDVIVQTIPQLATNPIFRMLTRK